MLLLTRKAGERILIGPDVRVTVVAVEGGRVHLGVEAPWDQPVWRGELRPAPGDGPQPAADVDTQGEG